MNEHEYTALVELHLTGEIEVLGKKLSQYHSAHNTSHRNCSGIDEDCDRSELICVLQNKFSYAHLQHMPSPGTNKWQDKVQFKGIRSDC